MIACLCVRLDCVFILANCVNVCDCNGIVIVFLLCVCVCDCLAVISIGACFSPARCKYVYGVAAWACMILLTRVYIVCELILCGLAVFMFSISECDL
jgi:hypothetical protein